MEQYISKDAVVAEIERIRNQEVQWMNRQGYTEYHQGLRDGYANILSFLNALEVKEVDLEEEYKNFVEDDPVYSKLVNNIVGKAIAKHFFELGLRSTITEEDCKLIWNIGDEIPNMPEEEFFKELLKRYKAQKGE